MTIGTSLFLIAVGAVLRYAVTAPISGINLRTTGLILMLTGVAALGISLYLIVRSRSRTGPPPAEMP
jgi:Domain of unknown function (DUF6458)